MSNSQRPSLMARRHLPRSMLLAAGSRIPSRIRSERRASHDSLSKRSGAPNMASLSRRTVSRSCFCDSFRFAARFSSSIYLASVTTRFTRRAPVGCFLGTNRENIGELLFPLPHPSGVIVQEVPAALPVAAQFLPHKVSAQHDADQFARTLSALGGAQNDVSGHVIRILDQAVGQDLPDRLSERLRPSPRSRWSTMDRNGPRGAREEMMRLRPCVTDCLCRMTRTPWLRSCRLSSNSSKLTTQFPRLCVSPENPGGP